MEKKNKRKFYENLQAFYDSDRALFKSRVLSERQLTEELCKKFGCGKLLSHTEKLFSSFCFLHARENNQRNQSADTKTIL